MKKKKAPKPPKEEVVFVSIEGPSALRRNILESSKETIESLKKYEDLKAVRKEKIQNIMKFKEDAKEIIKLIDKLKSTLPKTHIKVPEEKPVIEEKKEEIKPVPKPLPTTEIEKLQYELDDIESKLNALG